MEEYIVLNIETQKLADEVQGGWNNIAGFGVAVAGVTLVYPYARTYAYFVDTEVFPPKLWEKAGKFKDRIFDLAHLISCLYESPRIVTFNGIRFDYEVLRPYGFNPKLVQDKSYDIFHEAQKVIERKISLENHARATLGVNNSSKSKNVPEWFRNGAVENVIRHCRDDINITQLLYEFIRKTGIVYYFDKSPRRKPCRLTIQAEQ